jgi:hypothetical protein
MLELLLTLTSISLLDSLSAVPIALIPLAIILNGRSPVTGALSFIAGGFLIYLIFGIIIALGLDTLIDDYADKVISYIQSEPDCVELVIQILLGIIMIYFAWQFSKKTPGLAQNKSYESDIRPAQAFTLAASINIIGMWGALPYFAAISQILKVDLETPAIVWLLIYYNFIFALPLIGFVLLRNIAGKSADKLLNYIAELFTHWGKQIIVISLYLLGPLLIADGIGWFIGLPILDFTV